MKKSLIALAALAAVTAASAQSSVTISGALVLGVGATEIGTASSDLQIGRQTGNIQFAGTEDLGGGLKAGFQLQTAIGAVATSDTTTSIAANRTILGDRAANITLTGDFGGVLVGRANTSVRNQMGIADVSNLPVISGLSASSSAATTTADNGNYVNAGSDANARIIYSDTFANQVAYSTPTISGFNASVGVVPSQTVSTGVGDNGITKDTLSYTVNYSNGPLNASVNLTDSQTGANPYKMTTIVANYDLGVIKVGFAQQGIRTAGTDVSPGNGTMVTAKIPMGSGNWGLGYGRRTATAQTSASFGDDVKQVFVGYRYDLSKRTHLSAVYNNIDRAGTATDVKETHIMVGHSF